jgi:pyruvyltransferase
MKLLYMNAYGGNFGDLLGVEIVERLYGGRVRKCDLWQRKRSGRAGMLGLGSILHCAIDSDVVWGTGINPTWAPSRICTTLDIRAVRGPLTRAYIQNEWKIPVPEVYGDPAQLAKIVFPKFERNPIRRYGIIPHNSDIDMLRGDSVMPPTHHWRKVVEFVLESELIISSSLHGIIVAETFGVPARWLRSPKLPSTKTEAAFKYNDYYASTGRSLNDWSESISEALASGGKDLTTTIDLSPLKSAFPRNSLESSTPIYEAIDNITNRVFGQPLRTCRISTEG